MKISLRHCVYILCLCIFGSFFASTSQAAKIAKPRITVVISIDQFRRDYLTRFEDQFLPATLKNGAPGGFRFLMEKGAYFLNSQTAHAFNVTATGHATMLTGAYPYLHGIVANQWYDSLKGRMISPTSDEKVESVPNLEKSKGKSPRGLLVTTVGDELKNAMGGRPIVASIAIKDRAAIFMAGHRADLALWYSEHPVNLVDYTVASKLKSQGQWISSSYYLPEKKLPTWLQKWNSTDYFNLKHVPQKWELLHSEKQYGNSIVMPDSTVGSARGLGKRFPHTIDHVESALMNSPWGNSFTLDTALEMIKGLKMGQDEVPDLLAISLSSFDMLGHNFGPLSREMHDMTLRLDRQLSDFFIQLNKQIPGGLENVAIVLTADHGIQPNPTALEALKLPGAAFYEEDLIEQTNSFFKNKYGLSEKEDFVAGYGEANFYFNHELIKKQKKDLKEVSQALVDWLRVQPYVAAAHTKYDLLNGNVSPISICKKLALNTHPLRSGDVVFVPRPGFIDGVHALKEGTAHETATIHDAAVPLIFWGRPFRPGRYFDEAFLNDLAPTLSAALGILPPSGSEGRVLSNAMR